MKTTARPNRPRRHIRRRMHRGIDPYTITSLLGQLPQFTTMHELRDGLRQFLENDELWDYLENARTAENARQAELKKFEERVNDLMKPTRKRGRK